MTQSCNKVNLSCVTGILYKKKLLFIVMNQFGKINLLQNDILLDFVINIFPYCKILTMSFFHGIYRYSRNGKCTIWSSYLSLVPSSFVVLRHSNILLFYIHERTRKWILIRVQFLWKSNTFFATSFYFLLWNKSLLVAFYKEFYNYTFVFVIICDDCWQNIHCWSWRWLEKSQV